MYYSYREVRISVRDIISVLSYLKPTQYPIVSKAY